MVALPARNWYTYHHTTTEINTSVTLLNITLRDITIGHMVLHVIILRRERLPVARYVVETARGNTSWRALLINSVTARRRSRWRRLLVTVTMRPQHAHRLRDIISTMMATH